MDKQYIEDILKKFLSYTYCALKQGSIGYNNLSKQVICDNKKYVLRIYQGHSDIQRVLYESKVLYQLNNINIDINVPSIVKTLNGESFVKTKDNKIAILFNYIDGETPSLSGNLNYYSFGKAIAIISKAFKKLSIDTKPIYSACYDLNMCYSELPTEEVVNFCENPPDELFQIKDKLKNVSMAIKDFEPLIEKFKTLPHQLIHGDINASNVLIDNLGNVNTILDFEFVANDLRVMDLAVCISEIIANKEGMDVKSKEFFKKISLLIEGYFSEITLTNEEITAIPYLIVLRRLDTFIHFLIRYKKGIDSNNRSAKEIVIEQTLRANRQIKWINENKEKLLEIIK